MFKEFYYTPTQRKGQQFFSEYFPFEKFFEGDFSSIFDPYSIVGPDFPQTDESIFVYHLAGKLTSSPIGRGVFFGAYALSYLPVLESGPPARQYDLGELMYINPSIGGAFLV